MGSESLDRRNPCVPSHEYKRGNHKQQKSMQEFTQQIPTQATTRKEKRVEVTEETTMNSQRAREKTSTKTTRLSGEGEEMVLHPMT